MIALEHAAAPSEKPFAAAFWRAAFFMKMSKTIVAKIHIFSVFCPDFRFLAARVPEPGYFSITWVEKIAVWKFSSDYGTIFRSFSQNSSFNFQFFFQKMIKKRSYVSVAVSVFQFLYVCSVRISFTLKREPRKKAKDSWIIAILDERLKKRIMWRELFRMQLPRFQVREFETNSNDWNNIFKSRPKTTVALFTFKSQS